MQENASNIEEKNLADMHIHTYNSHDSVSTVDMQCLSAIDKGIGTIAITDHFDLVFLKEQNVYTAADNSYRDALRAKEKYKDKLCVLAGIEIAEGARFPREANEAASMHEYDVVIGSVHSVNFAGYRAPYSLIDFSVMSENELYRFMLQYFADMREMIEKTDFDVLAHLTCPLRYINGKYGRGVDITRFSDVIDDILKLIIDKGVALEINTSGFGTEVGFMPDESILKRYLELGGKKITLGSDAHTPENIGKGFEAAITMLKANGISCIYSYKARKPIKHEI